MKIWKNYRSSIILLGSLIIGAIIGLIFKEKTQFLKPFGTLFMNMMFVIIVPLIFLTITTSIAKIKEPKRLSKLITTTIIVFIITSLIAVIIGLFTTYSFKLVDTNNSQEILNTLKNEEPSEEKLDILNRTIKAISVNDFYELLSKENILALVLFSIIFGIAINLVGKDASPTLKLLESANKIVLKLVDLAFLYAPIGLGCFFATMVGSFGNSMIIYYLKTFIIYTITALLFFFIIYSIYAYIAAGKKGLKLFWQNIITTSITAISTCSSAASIPINIKGAKKIGVKDDIAETVIPLGTSFHKDGSIIGSVFKIMFLIYLFDVNVFSFLGIIKVTIVALIANVLVAAVPIGGGTISEMVIISMMGFPVASLPILTIIATIIDIPATLLNVVGDTSSSMLISRIIDGKKWLFKEET